MQDNRQALIRGLIIGLMLWTINAPAEEGSMKTYRRTIVVNGKLVSGANKQFPVLLALTTPELKPAAQGGHVAQADAGDLYFTAADGKTRLAHEIEKYDAASGSLKAWVLMPELSSGQDSSIYLCYGKTAARPDVASTGSVWDRSYQLVLHMQDASSNRRQVKANAGVSWEAAGKINGAARLDGATGQIEVANSEGLNPADSMTVEAWINSDKPGAESLQTIAAKWALSENMQTFEAYDAGSSSGLDSRGFLGAVFDGRYVYFSPQANTTLRENKTRRHGVALRYDTQGAFKDKASWQAYDAGQTDGMETKGYYGAGFDGRYIYFVPRYDGSEFHSRVLRYDTQGAFTDGSSWSAYDAGIKYSYQSAAFDGRYIYFVPGGAGVGAEKAGQVLRFDTRGAFKDKASWTIYCTADLAPGLSTVNFDGAVFDGRYVYFIPLSKGAPIRYDTTRPFTEAQSWAAFDAKPLNMKMCVGGVFDGRYIYYVPYAHDVVISYDTRGDFTDRQSWRAFNVSGIPGVRMSGWDGAFFDGKYVYFIPYWSGHGGEERIPSFFHGIVLRYDATRPFADAQSWQAVDAGKTDGQDSRGFNGGAFDGRYLYMAAWEKGEGEVYNIKGHGVMLRYDTTGKQAAYCLDYAACGHNGGLNAAVPGATFRVNTARGAFSVSANKILSPGWHHLAGVYDGRFLRLYIDGAMVNERSASGAIQACNTPLVIGRMLEGLGAVRGLLDEVRVSNKARSAEWIKTQFNNQDAPDQFLRIGPEEAQP